MLMKKFAPAKIRVPTRYFVWIQNLGDLLPSHPATNINSTIINMQLNNLREDRVVMMPAQFK